MIKLSRKAIKVGVAVFAAILLWGCSNALTESSAVRILQKNMDEQYEKYKADEHLKDVVEHLVVESCERLVLTAETMATARCTVRRKNKTTAVLPEVVFGKKPDGTWTVTSVTSAF